MSDERDKDEVTQDSVTGVEEASPPPPPPVAEETSASTEADTPDATDTESLSEEISEEVAELDNLIKERDDYLDALRRTQADFENYRKRMQREAAEARDRGAAALAEKLIDVLDVVDYALEHDPSDSVAQIAAKLNEVLAKEGLERVDALGSAFDPEQHDAVLHEEGDGPAEVIEVLRSGWRWNGRVLRAAMVKVKGS
jgi:molecular chaperone GrpE